MKKMKMTSALCVMMAGAFILAYFLPGKMVSAEKTGEALFKEHCAACHPNGSNIVNPLKTLHKKDLDANHIETARDIVGKMRNPGPFPTHPQEWAGMRMFDEKTIPDEDALKIADYILKTFR